MTFQEKTQNLSHELKPVHLLDYLRVIWKRKWLIFFTVISIVTFTAYKTYSAIPQYEATSKIMIEKEQSKSFSFEQTYIINTADKDFLMTQYKILTSRSMAKKIFDKLDLSKRPEFSNPKTGINSFLSSYRIEPIRETRLVNITVTHPDPKFSALLANTIAQVYIDQTMQRKLESIQYTVGWLSNQLDQIREKMRKSEDALQAYIGKEHIVSLPKADISESQSVLFSHLTEEKVKLETQLSQLSERYKPKHPKMIELSSQLANVNENLEKESVNLLALRQKQVQFHFLNRELEVNEKLFNSLLDKVTETDLLEAVKSSNISIVDPAEVPLAPVWPRKFRSLLLAVFSSLVLGVSLAFLLEYLDNTFKNDEDVETALGLHVLGHIPKSSIIHRNMSYRDVALACFKYPHSHFAEAYRYIRTGIAFSAIDKLYPVLLTTSTYPKEGKTTESINLAITLASTGEKVLLIEGDLRKPTFHKIFSVSNKNLGLSSYLSKKVREEEVVIETEVPHLSVVPCGEIPNNPAELLGSLRMKEFISWARTRYQKIIVDSSPVMAVADSIALSSLVDGVVYIIKANKTSRKAAQTCIEKLKEAHAKILGIVLNQVTPKGSGYYYQYNYSYYQTDKKRKNGRKPSAPLHSEGLPSAKT